ncbi:MAG TPA: DsbA family protein, partial [Vicinamibacterales bacterium]|nr:DsbA family protein [Vicinamibacterales bacterium]
KVPKKMFTRLAVVAFVAVVSLSPPLQQGPADELAVLKRQVQELREQQAQMQRELTAIKNFLQSLMQPRQGQGDAPEVPGIVGAAIPTANEPSMGSASAKITIMEISDYHCPFCKRQTLQTFPQVVSEYIKTGKVQYMFVDYPIAQLHPTAARAHEAANCAGDQGKYWEMHVSLFANPVAKDDAALIAQAKPLGLDTRAFEACLSSGRHAASVKASVARMEQLGISGTPMTVIGLTPAPGQPMKVLKYVYGAQPFSAFKEAIDSIQ